MNNEINSTQEWILMTNKAPDKSRKRYLTCDKEGYINIYMWCDGWNCHYDSKNEVCRQFEIKDVVAWMNLPEAYKGDEE